MASEVLRRLPYGARLRDILFFAGIHATRALILWPFFAVSSFVALAKNVVSPPTPAPVEEKTKESETNRPPLVRDKTIESDLQADPETTIDSYHYMHGDCFRFVNAGGKTTVVVCDQELANAAFKERALSFNVPSYQSKIRFGIKDYMTGPDAACSLSQFFRKKLNGSKLIKIFEARLSAAFDARLRDFARKLKKPATTMPLMDLVFSTVFAANVDAIFGDNVYTPEFYQKFRLFSDSVGHRSAPTKGKDGKDRQKSEADEAREFLLRRLHEARKKNTDAADVIKDIQSQLKMGDEDADNLALLILWGSNINLLPTSVWTMSLIMKHPNVLDRLRQEHQQLEGLSDRPLLKAAIAESLRLQSRPNMFRLATKDCTLKYRVQSGETLSEVKVEIKEGEWVWFFPRAFLHYNEIFYPEPHEFKPFDRFGVGKCPFRNGNAALRMFGGGTAPCPGKDYAVALLKVAVDGILLSRRHLTSIELADPGEPLPDSIRATVASTPPPSKDIMVTISRP